MRTHEQTGGLATRPSNFDDLLVFEAVVQRNDRFGDVPVAGGNAANRWAVRFMAFPDIPGVPGGQHFMFGVEVTRAIAGGPSTVRFLYGGSFQLAKPKL